MRQIVLVVHNVRSAHNVGSLLRSADGLGASEVIFSGYTPYPKSRTEERLPHLAEKIHRKIQKTALGAETSVNWRQATDISEVIAKLRQEGFLIAALEQTPKAIDIKRFESPPDKVALIVGPEVDGLDDKVLKLADIHLRIPMLGQKESLNVAVAGAIALFAVAR